MISNTSCPFGIVVRSKALILEHYILPLVYNQENWCLNNHKLANEVWVLVVGCAEKWEPIPTQKLGLGRCIAIALAMAIQQSYRSKVYRPQEKHKMKYVYDMVK